MIDARFTAAVAVALMAANAGAGVFAFTGITAWRQAVDNPAIDLFPAGVSPTFVDETFEGASTGRAASISGGSGWASWTASASSGDVQCAAAAVRSSSAGATLVITFGQQEASGSPIVGVGGDFRLFDGQGNAQSGRLWVRLANGASVVRHFSAEDPFAGFWISDASAPITSIRIQPVGNTSGGFLAGIDSLYLATVPAPGAISLLGAVGLIGRTRRRCALD